MILGTRASKGLERAFGLGLIDQTNLRGLGVFSQNVGLIERQGVLVKGPS